jgi:hypothetical protein
MKSLLWALLLSLTLSLMHAPSAHAGLFWNKKDCSEFESGNVLEEEKKRKIAIDVSGPLIGGEGEVDTQTRKRKQEVSDDILRRREDLHRQCLLWKKSHLTTEEFHELVLKSEGLKTATEVREEEAARARRAEEAEKREREATAAGKRQAKEEEKRRKAAAWAETKASIQSWARLGSAVAIIGGGAVVYTTTQTAKDTQAQYGPRDEWDDLTRLNTLGWYALAGGVVMMKIALSADGQGVVFHGAF